LHGHELQAGSAGYGTNRNQYQIDREWTGDKTVSRGWQADYLRQRGLGKAGAARLKILLTFSGKDRKITKFYEDFHPAQEPIPKPYQGFTEHRNHGPFL
jgi:hypothetical protein